MHNPFATNFISPGKLDFVFPGDDCLENLSARLATCDWRAQILGPHGSGKSTLLRNLTQRLQSQFEVTFWQPRDLQDIDTLPRHVLTSRSALFAIDGLEQLPSKAQARLLVWAQTYEVGLLVTPHQPVKLPVLHQTQPNHAVFQQIVQRLLGDARSIFTQQEVTQTFDQHRGNFREALFELYDKFEAAKIRFRDCSAMI